MELKTTKDKIIKVLGGQSAVAEICGVTQSAVSQWEFVPGKYIGTILAAGRKKGIDIATEFLDPVKTNGHQEQP